MLVKVRKQGWSPTLADIVVGIYTLQLIQSCQDKSGIKCAIEYLQVQMTNPVSSIFTSIPIYSKTTNFFYTYTNKIHLFSKRCCFIRVFIKHGYNTSYYCIFIGNILLATDKYTNLSRLEFFSLQQSQVNFKKDMMSTQRNAKL